MATSTNWLSGKILPLPRVGTKKPDNARISTREVDHEGPNNAIPNGTLTRRFSTRPKKKRSHVKVTRY